MAILNEHSMTYAALKEILDEFGERVKYIKTENNTVALNQQIIGYPFMLTNSDIEHETYDGYDFIKVKAYDPFTRKIYYSLIRTNDIRTVIVADKATDILDGFRC